MYQWPVYIKSMIKNGIIACVYKKRDGKLTLETLALGDYEEFMSEYVVESLEQLGNLGMT